MTATTSERRSITPRLFYCHRHAQPRTASKPRHKPRETPTRPAKLDKPNALPHVRRRPERRREAPEKRRQRPRRRRSWTASKPRQPPREAPHRHHVHQQPEKRPRITPNARNHSPTPSKSRKRCKLTYKPLYTSTLYKYHPRTKARQSATQRPTQHPTPGHPPQPRPDQAVTN